MFVGEADHAERDARDHDATRWRRRLVQVAAIVGALGCVALAVAGVVAETRRTAAWDSALEPLARQVELQRGTRFRTPVRVHRVGEQELAVIVVTAAPDSDFFEGLPAGALAALGLTPDEATGTGLPTGGPQQPRPGGPAAPVALYDVASDRLLVRTGVRLADRDPTVRRALAGELVTALLDQEIDLDRSPTDRDAAAVRLALVAGERNRVVRQMTGTPTSADATADAPDRPDTTGIERIGRRLPGALGEPFALSVAARGGLDAVDVMLRRPPSDVGRLLHPFSTTEAQGPSDPTVVDTTVAAPHGATDHLGSLLWYLAFATATTPADALRATGPAFVDDVTIERTAGRWCLTATLGTPRRSAPVLKAAVRAWVAAQPHDRSLTTDDALAGPDGRRWTVTLDACAPHTPRNLALEAALDTAVAVSFGTLSGVVDAGLPPDQARCAALAVVEALAPADLADRQVVARRVSTMSAGCS